MAFVAAEVAHTGDMKISTPTATLGIRGTTGLVEVPEGAAANNPNNVAIKLYPDADGRVGRIEVNDRNGARLGFLTQGSSGFTIRPGAGGRFTAAPLMISPQQALRDQGIVRQVHAAQSVGRQIVSQQRALRQANPNRNNLRNNPARQHGLQRQNNLPQRHNGLPQRPARRKHRASRTGRRIARSQIGKDKSSRRRARRARRTDPPYGSPARRRPDCSGPDSRTRPPCNGERLRQRASRRRNGGRAACLPLPVLTQECPGTDSVIQMTQVACLKSRVPAKATNAIAASTCSDSRIFPRTLLRSYGERVGVRGGQTTNAESD